MLAAAAGVPYRIPFGGSIQLQYAPDVGEAFARTSLLEVRGASTHNLDGEVVSIPDLVEIIGGVINDRQLITAANASLPLVSAVDGSSFVRLLGESVMRPVTDGVRDTIRRFATLLANGDIPFPSPNSPSPSVR
jgi:hypothetical protein